MNPLLSHCIELVCLAVCVRLLDRVAIEPFRNWYADRQEQADAAKGYQ
jgi:hypothetical protein